MVLCPKCGSKSVGRIGQNQYYCWDCNIEFIQTDRGVRMFRVEPDGTLVPEDQNGLTMEKKEDVAAHLSEDNAEDHEVTLLPKP